MPPSMTQDTRTKDTARHSTFHLNPYSKGSAEWVVMVSTSSSLELSMTRSSSLLVYSETLCPHEAKNSRHQQNVPFWALEVGWSCCIPLFWYYIWYRWRACCIIGNIEQRWSRAWQRVDTSNSLGHISSHISRWFKARVSFVTFVVAPSSGISKPVTA